MQNIDPILIVNLIFCIIILVMGFLGFRKFENPLLFYIGLAFGFFGVSHLAQLIGYPSNALALIITRTIGYLLVIFALFQTIKTKK